MGPTLSIPVRPLRRGAVAVAGLATLALAACGSDETTNAPPPSSAPVTSSSAPPTSASPSASPSAAPTASSNVDALLAAGKTALGAASGTTLVSIETENRNGTTVWEVQLVTDDGDEQELDVNAGGSEVTRKPALERQDAEDRRENRALVSAARLDYTDAVKAMPSSVADGTISELNLDTEGSRTVWEADAREPGGQRHEIQVDARNGDVVRDRT